MLWKRLVGLCLTGNSGTQDDAVTAASETCETVEAGPLVRGPPTVEDSAKLPGPDHDACMPCAKRSCVQHGPSLAGSTPEHCHMALDPSPRSSSGSTTPTSPQPIGTLSTSRTPRPSSGSVEGSASVTRVLSGYVASGVDAGSCTAPSAHASLKGCVDDMPCGARSHSEQRTVSLVVVDMLPIHAAPSVAQVTPGDAHTMQQSLTSLFDELCIAHNIRKMALPATPGTSSALLGFASSASSVSLHRNVLQASQDSSKHVGATQLLSFAQDLLLAARKRACQGSPQAPALPVRISIYSCPWSRSRLSQATSVRSAQEMIAEALDLHQHSAADRIQASALSRALLLSCAHCSSADWEVSGTPDAANTAGPGNKSSAKTRTYLLKEEAVARPCPPGADAKPHNLLAQSLRRSRRNHSPRGISALGAMCEALAIAQELRRTYSCVGARLPKLADPLYPSTHYAHLGTGSGGLAHSLLLRSQMLQSPGTPSGRSAIAPLLRTASATIGTSGAPRMLRASARQLGYPNRASSWNHVSARRAMQAHEVQAPGQACAACGDQ